MDRTKERVYIGMLTRKGALKLREWHGDVTEQRRVLFALPDGVSDTSQLPATAKGVWLNDNQIVETELIVGGYDADILFPIMRGPRCYFESERQPEEMDYANTEATAFWLHKYESSMKNLVVLARYIHDRLIELLVQQKRIGQDCHGGVRVRETRTAEGDTRYELLLKDEKETHFHVLDLNEESPTHFEDTLRLTQREYSHFLLYNIATGR